MQIEVPVNYIYILAFQILLKYENKRSITINDLLKYKKELLEQIKKDYNDPNHIFYLKVDQWEKDFEFINDSDNIEEFLNVFPELFYIDDNNICLYDNVSYYDLSQIEKQMQIEQNISNRFCSCSEEDHLFELLRINKIKSLLEKFLKIETEIEKEYLNLGAGNTNKTHTEQKLKKILFMRAMFLNNICQNEEYVIDAFRCEAQRMETNNVIYYDKSPVDLNIWNKSNYKRHMEEEIEDLDDRIYDIYQYSIFGKTTLSIQKMNEMLQNLYFSNNRQKKVIDESFFENLEFEDFNQIDNFEFEELASKNGVYYLIDRDEIDVPFYLTYLTLLNNYIEKYGKNADLDVCLEKKD